MRKYYMWFKKLNDIELRWNIWKCGDKDTYLDFEMIYEPDYYSLFIININYY